jgi:hypothetical protein
VTAKPMPLLAPLATASLPSRPSSMSTPLGTTVSPQDITQRGEACVIADINEVVIENMRVHDYHKKWLQNAERQGVPSEVVADIARQHHLTPESFKIFEKFTEINDPDGKSFFLIPAGTSADDARKAVLMTYVLNAGTDYGKAGKQRTDFPDTPYSAAEVRRIIERQKANSWTYDQDVGFLGRNGACLATTPNGMLMGLGGNWIQKQFSQQGGTAWGDIFIVNVDASADPVRRLRQIVQSGHAWFNAANGKPFQSNLALDRVLHHEELHCRQWAAKGHAGMIIAYIWEVIREVFGKTNRLEEVAGLSDGGYR